MKVNRSIISNFNPDNDVTFYQNVTAESLAGTGTRMVVASSTGLLSTQALPSGTIGGSGTVNYIPKFTPDGVTLGNSVIYETSSNIGINTTSPDARFRVSGTANGTHAIFSVVDGRGLEIATAIVAGTNDAGSVLNARGAASGTMIFQTDNTESMRINAAQRLLIGTTTDSGERLQVSGSVKITSNLAVDTSTLFVDATTNLVGIGTASPYNGKLHVESTNNVYSGYFYSPNTSGQSLGLYVQAGTNSSDASFIVQSASGSDYMTIKGNGDVGIGNANPSAKLHVTGDIRTNAPSGGTAKNWKLGAAASDTGATANTKIEVEVDGVLYYIMAYAV